MENIIFYNFSYTDEVLKKKNIAYSIVSFSISIGLAMIIRTIFQESESSLVILIVLWLFSLVLFGFSSKLYKYVSKLQFNSLMIQKNLGLAMSYSGFLFGSTVIITSAFSHEHHDITGYTIQAILKTLLGTLILPVFIAGIKYVFKINESEQHDSENSNLGFGVYEGAIFVTSALLTAIIIGQIHFGTIYPFF
jgi:uncharacterized membrane protein YjfL (UPF0719 family)